MRRKILFIVTALVFLLLLTACSANQTAEERVLALRERFNAATPRFAAHVTADYGDRVYGFTLRFDAGASSIQVLAPEVLAGIQIGIAEGGTVLQFEGAELNTGALTADGLSPLSALPTIVAEWNAGHIIEAHYETLHDIRTVVMTTAVSDTVRHKTWFNAETDIPIQAVILSDGFAVITAVFEGGGLFDGDTT